VMSREQPSSRRRQYLLSIIMIAAGALISWWALSRPWLSYSEPLLGALPDDESTFAAATALIRVSGASLAPLAAAMPVLLLAGIAGVVGSRGMGRRIIGVVIVVAGGLMALSILNVTLIQGLGSLVPDEVEEYSASAVFAWVTSGGALLGVAGGVLVIARGASWPSLGRGYERAAKAPRDDWEALDRGLDPTVDAGDEPESR
jgi:hypothetical protein